MSILLSRRKARAKDQRTWWIIGLGSAAACGAWLFFRARSRAGAMLNAYPEAASRDPSLPASAPAPAPGDWVAGGGSMDTLVPAAYAVPDSAAALDPDSAFSPDAAVDAPPVGSVYSDPAPTAGSPAEPDPTASRDTGSGPEGELWVDALRLAMEREPLDFGYNRSAWTAPLLGRYLLDTQGVSIPLPRLRGALKDLGYHWEHTRYVQSPRGIGQSP